MEFCHFIWLPIESGKCIIIIPFENLLFIKRWCVLLMPKWSSKIYLFISVYVPRALKAIDTIVKKSNKSHPQCSLTVWHNYGLIIDGKIPSSWCHRDGIAREGGRWEEVLVCLEVRIIVSSHQHKTCGIKKRRGDNTQTIRRVKWDIVNKGRSPGNDAVTETSDVLE